MNHVTTFSTFLVLFITFAGNSVFGANILFMHSYGSYSHRISMMPIAEALVKRGHNITYIAPVKTENCNPKIIDIVPKRFHDFMNAINYQEFNVNLRIDKQNPSLFAMFVKITTESCKSLIESVEFQRWLASSPKIDLVFADLIPDCAVAVAYKLKAKVVLYGTVSFPGIFVDIFNIPDESLVTYVDNPFLPPMTFWEKIKNTIIPLGWLYNLSANMPYFESMLKEGLSLDYMPSIYDLFHNISLVFMTGNYISDQARSLPPMFVSVPALHVQTEQNPLPQDLEKFINGTSFSLSNKNSMDEGFVYISLGTVVQASSLPDWVQTVFLNAIKAFPKVKFLWKWDGAFPKNIPDNLYMAKWFPQQDVLSHPKIRAFVTQAGRPSMQEAISFAVPVISLPILGDQDFNAMRLAELGAGIMLEIGELTNDQLQGALSRILYDKSYKQNVQKVSNIFKDSPMKPMDTAIWWTEYVLRHDDLSYLKPAARHENWYQRRKLDVWLVLLGVATTFFLCFTFLIVQLLRCLYTSKAFLHYAKSHKD